MRLPNRLPDLDADKTKDKKIIYGLYSMNRYDDGHEDAQYCFELSDSIEELDKKAQTIIKNHKSHCESNKTFTPYSLVIRKVKHTIESEIAEEYKEHFIPDFELKTPNVKTVVVILHTVMKCMYIIIRSSVHLNVLQSILK